MNKRKQFFVNGMLLSAVSLLMRTIGVGFNVYVSNRIGAEAMGLFSLIGTVYGFALTLATSGVGLATTRMVSEALGEQSVSEHPELPCRNATTISALRKCFLYATVFSLFSALFLYILAPRIGTVLLRDKRTISSLRILALSLPPTALISVLSGYFTAVRRVWKNALTSISEQLLRILFCSFLLSAIFAPTVESACQCIAAGGMLATTLSFLIQFVLYLAEKKQKKPPKIPNKQHGILRKKLFGIALPVAFSAYLRSALVTIEHILIPWGLERSGADRARSLAAYGTVCSMVFPVIFFPSAILASFSSLLVPEVSEARAAGRTEQIERLIQRVMETALLFSIGTAGIMSCFSAELGNVIYPNTDAGRYIRLLAPLIPIMYLDTSVDAILKGLGEQVYSMGVNVADALISVILVLILIPRMGIEGYILTVYVTECFNTIFSITRLLHVTRLRPHIIRWIFLPLGSVIFSTSLCQIFLPYLPSLPSAAELLTHLIICASSYLLLIGFCSRKRGRDRPKCPQNNLRSLYKRSRE